MSIFNHNYITIDSIIEYLYKDGKELTADALIKLADPNTYTHELLELLCIYVNCMSKFSRKEDAGFICKLQVKNAELVAMLQSIRERYDKAVTELVESKRSEIDLEKRCQRLELDNITLNQRLELRTNELKACGYKIS